MNHVRVAGIDSLTNLGQHPDRILIEDPPELTQELDIPFDTPEGLLAVEHNAGTLTFAHDQFVPASGKMHNESVPFASSIAQSDRG